jgi:hypothetical protein
MTNQALSALLSMLLFNLISAVGVDAEPQDIDAERLEDIEGHIFR